MFTRIQVYKITCVHVYMVGIFIAVIGFMYTCIQEIMYYMYTRSVVQSRYSHTDNYLPFSIYIGIYSRYLGGKPPQTPPLFGTYIGSVYDGVSGRLFYEMIPQCLGRILGLCTGRY